jgi:ketosteroid isomerase-like protein
MMLTMYLTDQKMLNYDTAKAIVDEAHRAWSAGNLNAVLRCYTEDIFYQRNATDSSEPPLVICGRDGMATYLGAITATAKGMAVVESFQFHSGIARTRVAYFLEALDSGHVHAGTYRQILTFRGMQISRMEQFHDAARLAAFLRLVDTHHATDRP